ncbi:MAG: DUF3108 domain-containing protein [Opitutaceae bacterium]
MPLRALLSLIAALPAAAAAAELAFRDGEKLTYRVSWAIVPGAGEITVHAARAPGPGGAPQLVVTTTTTTRRLARMLLPFDAEETCVFDLSNGHLLSLRETSVQREKRTETAVTFDHARREATYSGPKSAGQPQLLRMPDGEPTDLIMGLLQTRTWNLAPGGSREALVLFANDFYELTVHHAGTEDVRTPLGTFRTSVLEPRMERTPPKGMFKRGSTVRVWIAEDPRRL